MTVHTLTLQKPSVTQLTAAAAIVHASTDGQLMLEMRDGRQLTVGWDESDTATPCQLRRAIAEHPDRTATNIVEVEVGGAFISSSGPVVHRHTPGAIEHWFVTDMCPTRAEAALTNAPLPIPSDVVAVRLIPDPVLGVTTGCLTIDEQRYRPQGGEIAMIVVAHLMVEELVDHARNGGVR